VKFRVWCTSFGETDEEGTDIISCSIIEACDFLRNPTPEKGVIKVGFAIDASAAAARYAKHVNDNTDGDDISWPLIFRVRAEDGTESDFEVERDYKPVFSAAAL
jgi:hypothetical protein